jgi:hypothetical protein
MNCFNHRDKPAIGLCKSCAKALCGDCLTELPNGVACKGSCEDRVNLMNRILDRNSLVLKAARHQIRHRGMIMLFLGTGCSLFAFWAYFEMKGSFLPYFVGFLAVFSFLAGISTLSRSEQFPRIEEKKTQV